MVLDNNIIPQSLDMLAFYIYNFQMFDKKNYKNIVNCQNKRFFQDFRYNKVNTHFEHQALSFLNIFLLKYIANISNFQFQIEFP